MDAIARVSTALISRSPIRRPASVAPAPSLVSTATFGSRNRRRSISVSARSGMEERSYGSSKDAEPLLRRVISSMEKVYLSRNPTAKAILDLVCSHDGDHICYDHFAFRTFGLDGFGIDSMAEFFMDCG